MQGAEQVSNPFTSLNFSICSLQPPTSLYVTSGFSSTLRMDGLIYTDLVTNNYLTPNLHHSDSGIDLRGEGDVYLVPDRSHETNWIST